MKLALISPYYDGQPSDANKRFESIVSECSKILKEDLVVVTCTGNEVRCKDSLSKQTVISQYFKSPKGFKYCREVNMEYGISLKVKFRHAIHYNVSLMILKKFKTIVTNKYTYLTIPALPFSFCLYLYLLYKKIDKGLL